jgi:general secretion pathway protein A
MYEAHFQLRQPPFSIAPDPEFLYLSNGHREALAHLTYGLTQGGFVLISGEVGTGKTTLLRNLLRQMPPDVDVAFILNPRLTVRELLETVCDELGIAYSQNERTSVKNYVDALSAHLLETHAAGRSTLLIIDEAQNLAPAVLEQIRLLTNLETDKRKLLRIILLGQPELLDLLARKELRQLAQRITARYHLGGLDREDTFAYVIHRLQRAGGSALIFTRPALYRLYRISGGIPRLINLIADRALLGTYAAGRHRVTWHMVGRAAREVLGVQQRRANWVNAAVAAGLVAVAVAAYLLVTRLPTLPAQPAGSVEQATDAPSVTPSTAGAAEPAGAEAPAEAAPAAEPDAPAATGSSDETLALPAEPVNVESAAGAPPAAASIATDEATGSPPDTPEESAAATPTGTRLVRPDMTTFQSQRLAYQAAFTRWGADFSTASLATIPCDFAPVAGLQCLGGSGTWNDLRSIDLPAVLELWDAGSTPFYGALVAMSGDVVTLAVGGTELRYALEDLADNWFGGYVLLWKMPPGYGGTVRQGDRHTTVRWMREQLAALGFGTPATAEPEAFDPALRDALIRFQQREGMQADGIAGPMTWIRIAQRTGIDQPTLQD